MNTVQLIGFIIDIALFIGRKRGESALTAKYFIIN
jgi:hypothetical protein